MNEAKRPRWPARAHDPAIAKWGKAALVCAAIAAVWFLLRDDTLRLDAGETAVPVPSLATDSTMTSDPYELYRRQQYEAALPLLLTQAEAGFSLAQCMAGKILAEGRGGVSPDRIEAAKWLDLCTRDTHSEDDDEAREMLDSLIKTAGWDVVGEGKYRAFQWQQAYLNTEENEPGSASELVLRDLGAMDGDAAFALGTKLNDGNNSPVDYEKALRCFKRAAEFDVTEAHFNVAVAYYAGKGVKADPREALHWFKKAAEGGFAEAATMVGVMAARGHGMAPDINMALAYLKRGADLGDSEAGLIRESVAAGNIPQ
jgi:TPR repeat protein